MDRLTSMLGLDYRSLAIMRIGISLIVLLDLYVRSWHLHEFYTDAGVLPIPASLYLQEKAGTAYWSVHYISGSYNFNAMLFGLSAIFALLLLLGWHTRTFTFLSWLILTSLQNRQEFVLNGGDLLLRLTLFWSIFLPLGRKFSLDSCVKRYRNKWTGNDVEFISMASVAWLFQFSAMYIFSFGLKFGVTWWEGTAVSAALQQEQFLTQSGLFLRSILFPPSFFTDPSLRLDYMYVDVY